MRRRRSFRAFAAENSRALPGKSHQHPRIAEPSLPEDLPPSLRYEGKASLDWFLDGWVNGTSLPRLDLQGVKFAAKANTTLVTGMIRQRDAPESGDVCSPLCSGLGQGSCADRPRVCRWGGTSFHLSAPPAPTSSCLIRTKPSSQLRSKRSGRGFAEAVYSRKGRQSQPFVPGMGIEAQ